MRRLLPLLVVPPLLVLAGCGADGSSDGTDGSREVFPGVTVRGGPEEEPQVEVDAPFETDETRTEVIEEGDGATLETGDTVLVRHIGLNGRTGDEFDNSWSDGGEPVPFTLAEGALIPGFLDGLVGQTVGSRVAIAIAPEDGYGPDGGNPQISVQKDDSLIFVVDVEDTALAQAEGEPQTLSDEVPQLETNADDIPTGFTATDLTRPAPDDVTTEVAIAGSGGEVQQGQTISFKYLAQIYPDGRVVDDSYSRGQTIDTIAGSGQPPCWDALVGQAVGSRIVLVCPPASVFGGAGNEQLGVGGTDTLLFAIDVLSAA